MNIMFKQLKLLYCRTLLLLLPFLLPLLEIKLVYPLEGVHHQKGDHMVQEFKEPLSGISKRNCLSIRSSQKKKKTSQPKQPRKQNYCRI